MIWDHDQEILSEGEDFYAEISRRFDRADWASRCELLDGDAPDGVSAGTGQRFRLRTLASRRVQKSLSCCPRWRASLDSMTYLSIRI